MMGKKTKVQIQARTAQGFDAGVFFPLWRQLNPNRRSAAGAAPL